MKRGLTHAEAIEYVGVKRRTFDEMWRPKLNPMRQGSCLIFDRLDLDRVFDEFKAAAAPAAANDDGAEPLRHNGPRNGRPSQETGERRPKNKGYLPPERTEPGRSTSGGGKIDFASAASAVLKNAG